MGEAEFRHPDEIEVVKKELERKAEDLLDEWKREGYTHVLASLNTGYCKPFREEKLPMPAEIDERHQLLPLEDGEVKRALVRYFNTGRLIAAGGKSELRERGEE